MDLELTQIHEYKVFKDTGKAQFHNGKVVTPDGFQKIRVHFVYAVKNDGRFKARLVADGHLTKEPVESIYSGVVSSRRLRMVVFLSQLNDLEIWGADVGNAYLEAYTDEKLCIIAGPEFKELQGHLLIMIKALYGTRSGGARWHDRLFDILQELKFKPSKADPDVWMRPEPGGTCYEYIAVYVDDLAIAAKDPQAFCHELKKRYNLKLKGVGPLEYHLGCTYKKDPDGTLAADPRRYVNKILESYERMFKEKPRKSRPPLEGGDHPELDTPELCDEHQTKQFQTLIGQLQWLISLGVLILLFMSCHFQGSEPNLGRDTLIEPKGLLDIYCPYLMVQSDSELGSLTSHLRRTKNMIGPEVSTLEPVSRSHMTFPNL